MWIKTVRCNSNYIARVVNGEAVKNQVSKEMTYNWCDGYDAFGTEINPESVEVSLSKTFPRQWKNLTESRNWNAGNWSGKEVKFNGEDFVSVEEN